MERIITINKKLEELRNLDKRFSIFGSSRHKYQQNPTLIEEEIRRIENENEITLSEEYREILTHIGNGGAGCGYGLEALSLENIDPPYAGTKHLLRNWEDPNEKDMDMVDLDEISGYIKLFDYGCGMETCLIVKGEEKGELIFFDCDGRFEKIETKSLLDIYEEWLDESISILRRIERKLATLSLQEVIDSEWELKNFSVNGMILSLIGAKPLKGGYSGNELKAYIEKEHYIWKKKKKKEKL